jgi:signal transduction histidine kinase
MVAIRHSNFVLESPSWLGVKPRLPLRIGYANQMSEHRARVTRGVTFHQTFLISIFLTFALSHLLLFCFHSQLRANLYFAALAASAVVGVLAFFQPTFTNNPAHHLWYMRLYGLALPLLAISSLLFVYALTAPKPTKIFFSFLLVSFGVYVWAWFKPFATIRYLSLLTIATIPEIIRMVIIASIKKRTELLKGSWIILLGMLPLTFLGAYQISVEIGAAPVLSFGYIPTPFYSMLVIMISMSVFLARTFAQTNKNLQERSNELHQLNVALEDRVTQRTTELAEANQGLERRNVELQETYNELRQTQNQLVQSEKMAALGNPVAGIAHEVNNPVGAVNSAADVINRCINRITSVLESSETADEIKNNKGFQRSLQILQNNNQITATAGERIAKLVGGLRNFARLDEAEFQKVDIHEGIDSTRSTTGV